MSLLHIGSSVLPWSLSISKAGQIQGNTEQHIFLKVRTLDIWGGHFYTHRWLDEGMQETQELDRRTTLIFWIVPVVGVVATCSWCQPVAVLCVLEWCCSLQEHVQMMRGHVLMKRHSGYCLKGTRNRNSSESCGEYSCPGITSSVLVFEFWFVMAGMQRWSLACTATKDVVSKLACTDGCGNSRDFCLTCFMTSFRFVPGSSFDFHLQKTVSRLQWSSRWSRWWRHCRTVQTVRQGSKMLKRCERCQRFHRALCSIWFDWAMRSKHISFHLYDCTQQHSLWSKWRTLRWLWQAFTTILLGTLLGTLFGMFSIASKSLGVCIL